MPYSEHAEAAIENLLQNKIKNIANKPQEMFPQGPFWSLSSG
jgi:hypothetical protein